jgi:hypothetical protein
MSSQDNESRKKDYSSPNLVVYGNISELTQNVTNLNANMDNPTMKT